MEINKIYNMDCREGLGLLPDESIDMCVTSPPYWGLRDYGMDAQIGMENNPDDFIKQLVAVFAEVKRVLKKDGTLWLNIGDSYAAGPKTRNDEQACRKSTLKGSLGSQIACKDQMNKVVGDLKPKDLVGIPWMLAFALRADGWYLRQDIIWHKPNCMPESVTDRCTKNHEYLFLLTKSSKYHYDHIAIQEDAVWDVDGTGTLKRKLRQDDSNKSKPDKLNAGIRKVYTDGKNEQSMKSVNGKRNKRSVWTVSPAMLKEAHFATFPEKLIVDCIKAGCPENGIVLDPFMGAGTTGLVSYKLDRNYIGYELNPDYIKIAEKRISDETKQIKLFAPERLTSTQTTLL